MMVSRVTPLAEDEGAVVDGVEEAGGVVVSIRGYLNQIKWEEKSIEMFSKRDNKNRARGFVIEL